MSWESVRRPARNPCGSCPYRRDVPSGVWSEEEYAKLPKYDGPTGDQPPGVFMCHQQNERLCSGWVGCHDMDESMALRIAALGGMAPDEVEATRDYQCPVPLFETGAAAAEHGRQGVGSPGGAARRTIDKLNRKRGVTT